MTFELFLLGALIIIFIVSFCGLLQKVRQTYERERIIAEAMSRRRAERWADRNRTSNDSFAEIYINPTYRNDEASSDAGVFPAAPPPYTAHYQDPPPKYEDIIKDPETGDIIFRESRPSREEPPTQRSSSPPPYTISVPPV